MKSTTSIISPTAAPSALLTDRRDFLRSTSALALGGMALSFPTVLRGEPNGSKLKIGLVGCGGRGTGAAANALGADSNSELHAVADVFASQADGAINALSNQFKDRINVPAERRFAGLDGYQALLASGVDVVVLASAGDILTTPLTGAGQPNATCTGSGEPAQEKTENPRSTAIRVQFGAFRFLNVGDLSGAPLFALTCPTNLIGTAELYLIAHHGGNDGADPSLFAAVKPRVAIMNNGPRKGAQARTFATIRGIPSLDGWQLHRSDNANIENFADARIANLDENTSAWLKVSASLDGSFTVTNGRTGHYTAYPR